MLFNGGSIEIFGGVNVNRNPPQKIKFLYLCIKLTFWYFTCIDLDMSKFSRGGKPTQPVSKVPKAVTIPNRVGKENF